MTADRPSTLTSTLDDAESGWPNGLAIDSAGNLYIADRANSRARKVSTDGIITTVAGNGNCCAYSGEGGPATSAQLGTPIGLAFDSAGNLHRANAGSHRILRISRSGIISTVAGNGSGPYSGDGGSATRAQRNGPVGLAADGAGSLYIADTYNGRIRIVCPDGMITTVAGDGTAGYSGDGGPATSAQFGSLSGLAFDSAGNLYVADQYFNAVRLLQPVSHVGLRHPQP